MNDEQKLETGEILKLHEGLSKKEILALIHYKLDEIDPNPKLANLGAKLQETNKRLQWILIILGIEFGITVLAVLMVLILR